jgi:hypothetical protein
VRSGVRQDREQHEGRGPDRVDRRLQLAELGFLGGGVHHQHVDRTQGGGLQGVLEAGVAFRRIGTKGGAGQPRERLPIDREPADNNGAHHKDLARVFVPFVNAD